jgi:hypothetical protein
VTLWAFELAAKTGKLPVLGAAWYKKPNPTALHVARPGQAVERSTPGGEVVQGGEVSRIAAVAAQQ